jgi:hypothetical protein
MFYRKLDDRNGQQTFDKISLFTVFKVYVHICCSSCTIRRSWHRTLQGTEPFLLTLHLDTAASNTGTAVTNGPVSERPLAEVQQLLKRHRLSTVIKHHSCTLIHSHIITYNRIFSVWFHKPKFEFGSRTIPPCKQTL